MSRWLASAIPFWIPCESPAASPPSALSAAMFNLHVSRFPQSLPDGVHAGLVFEVIVRVFLPRESYPVFGIAPECRAVVAVEGRVPDAVMIRYGHDRTQVVQHLCRGP